MLPDTTNPPPSWIQLDENPAGTQTVDSAPELVPPQSASPIPAAAVSAEQSPGNIRPLNVTDALGYLDAVKIQFQEQPDVYNRFLDIMKDFKSQTCVRATRSLPPPIHFLRVATSSFTSF